MGDSTRLSDLPPMQENIHYQLQAPMQPTVFPPSQQPPSFQNQSNQSLANTVIHSASQSNYMPINIHPNPYGNNHNNGGIGNELPPWDTQMNQRDKGGFQPPSLLTSKVALLEHKPEKFDQGNQSRRNIADSDQMTSMDSLPDFVPTQQQKLPSRDIPMSTTNYSQDEEIHANYIPTPPKNKRVKDYIKEYDETESTRIREHESSKFRQHWIEEAFRSYQLPLLIAILYFIFQMNVVSRVLFLYLGKFGWFYQENGAMNVYGMLFKSILFASVYWVIQYILYYI
jgi:hypothetical protein